MAHSPCFLCRACTSSLPKTSLSAQAALGPCGRWPAGVVLVLKAARRLYPRSPYFAFYVCKLDACSSHSTLPVRIRCLACVWRQ